MKINRQFIADKAGVSPATVSEVLNRNPKARISAEVAERVRAIAARYAYAPNYSARALVTGKTFNIGIAYSETIYKSFEDPFRSAILRGIERELDASNYNLLFMSGKNEDVPSNSFSRAVSAKSVDGMIVFWPVSARAMDMVETRQIPYVIVDGLPDDREANCVLPDNEPATFKAAKHLIASGCKNIWFVYGRLHFHHVTNVERPQGYVKAMREAGLEPKVLKGFPRLEPCKEAMTAYFAEMGLPDAIMTSGDVMTLACYEALKEHGPESLAKTRLIGFDDLPALAAAKPPISAIHSEISEIGQEAARLLMKAIENPSLPKKVLRLPTSLVIRET